MEKENNQPNCLTFNTEINNDCFMLSISNDDFIPFYKKNDVLICTLNKNIRKGDKIVINGGLIVEITKIEERFFTVKSIDNSSLRVARDYVAAKWED